MEFDINKACTSLNADTVRIGCKGYFADKLKTLREAVEQENLMNYGEIDEILGEEYESRFLIKSDNKIRFTLFYPVEESIEKSLTLDKLVSLSGDNGVSPILDTYDLLASCAKNVTEAIKAYARWDYDTAHAKEHKIEFAKAIADIVCNCGAISCGEDIDLDKVVMDILSNDRNKE